LRCPAEARCATCQRPLLAPARSLCVCWHVVSAVRTYGHIAAGLEGVCISRGRRQAACPILPHRGQVQGGGAAGRTRPQCHASGLSAHSGKPAGGAGHQRARRNGVSRTCEHRHDRQARKAAKVCIDTPSTRRQRPKVALRKRTKKRPRHITYVVALTRLHDGNARKSRCASAQRKGHGT